MSVACTIDATGIHSPTYEDVLTYLKTQMQAIYGSDIYLEPDSQDGQMLGIFALAITDCNAATVAVYNAYSPTTAQGTGLSNVVQINGIERSVPTKSTVDLLLSGASGTVITNGIVEDNVGRRWFLPASVTIPLSTTITVTATAEYAGALQAAANTVNIISTPIRNWNSANNPTAATPGLPVETDAALRQRQRTSTALPSQTVLDGIIGAVSALTGIQEVRAYENDTNLTNADGLPPHSIALVVDGGDANAIAETIANKKTPGAYTHGTTIILVPNTYGGVTPIRFFRPTQVSIKINVSITPLTGYSSAIDDKIKAALVEYFNNYLIGADVLYTKLYVPANLTGADSATFDIDAIEIAINPGVPAASNITIDFDQRAVTSTALISIL